MRTLDLLTLAGLAQVGLSSAIPASKSYLSCSAQQISDNFTVKHDHLHHERRAPAVVETVTTTFYQTVIWVDKNGKPVSTEVNDPPPAATQAQANSTPAALPLSSPIVANLAGFGRPGLYHPSQPAQDSEQAQPTAPAQAPGNKGSPSAVAASPSVTSSAGTNGNSQGSSNAPGGMGVCYDMIDSSTQCKSQGTINQEFSFLKGQGYGIVRTYGIGCPLGNIISGAAQSGLKLMIGLNTIGNLNGDLNTLIGMVNGAWSNIDTVYIGNELVNTGAASSGQVAAAVTTAKGILSGAGFSGSVVTVDTFNVMQTDPTICSTSDYCAANAHAFFDANTVAASAGQFVKNAYNNVMQANGGKKTIITESGWPWKGNCNGQACPSVDNQKTAMNSLMQTFGGMPSNIFMFQAYNAGYKAPGPLGVEQYFGIYDSDHYNGGIGPA